MSVWSVAHPQKIAFDAPVTALRIRVIGGAVNVVGTDESSPQLHVSEIEGAPLVVTHHDGVVTVEYEDAGQQHWRSWLNWWGDRSIWQRTAVVSLTVPTATRLEVGMVSAGAVVSGIEGRTEIRGINGDTTLVGLSGPVHANTVAGSVEAQNMRGDFSFKSVSGDLTVVDGAGSSVQADSVSGSMIVDLAPAGTRPGGRPPQVKLASVSGEIAVRLPHPADTEVEAKTSSGVLSSSFEDLRVDSRLATKITGRLGAGQGKLKASTVSGSISLLRRPSYDEPDPGVPATPVGSAPDGSPIGKKVL
jgi:hypothetical protein